MKFLVPLLLLLTSYTNYAQVVKYGRDPIPVSLSSSEKIKFINSGSYTHVWVYEKHKLTLSIFNENLNKTVQHDLDKGRSLEGEPLFALIKNSSYYAVLRKKKESLVLKVNPDGNVKAVPHNFQQILYIGTHRNKIFIAETSFSSNQPLLTIKQLDTSMQVEHQLTISTPEAITKPSFYFKPINDSTIIYALATSNHVNESRLKVCRINVRNGAVEKKDFVASDSEVSSLTIETDADENLYLINHVSFFPDTLRLNGKKQTANLIKINKNWTIGNSVSLDKEVSQGSFLDVNAYNIHTFLFDQELLLINLYASGNINTPDYSITNSRDGENKRTLKELLRPLQGQEQQRWQKAIQNKPPSEWPSYLDPNVESRIDAKDPFSNDRAYQTHSQTEPGGILHLRSGTKFYELTIIDTALNKAVNWKLETPQASFRGKYLIHSFSSTSPYGIRHTQLHPDFGTVDTHQHSLSPLYIYLTSLMEQKTEKSFILPYVYKNKVFFAIMQVEE
jgi:hypothetical protein